VTFTVMMLTKVPTTEHETVNATWPRPVARRRNQNRRVDQFPTGDLDQFLTGARTILRMECSSVFGP
jgi:hypothetical protein